MVRDNQRSEARGLSGDRIKFATEHEQFDILSGLSSEIARNGQSGKGTRADVCSIVFH
jgi:hypothetical protein